MVGCRDDLSALCAQCVCFLHTGAGIFSGCLLQSGARFYNVGRWVNFYKQRFQAAYCVVRHQAA